MRLSWESSETVHVLFSDKYAWVVGNQGVQYAWFHRTTYGGKSMATPNILLDGIWRVGRHCLQSSIIPGIMFEELCISIDLVMRLTFGVG
jgi:hypothetical protein